jgi:hypothetical protein
MTNLATQSHGSNLGHVDHEMTIFTSESVSGIRVASSSCIDVIVVVEPAYDCLGYLSSRSISEEFTT